MYELLHYRGRMAARTVVPGTLLGCDEMFRPYEVIDAEYDPWFNISTVHLQLATVEGLKRARQRGKSELR